MRLAGSSTAGIEADITDLSGRVDALEAADVVLQDADVEIMDDIAALELVDVGLLSDVGALEAVDVLINDALGIAEGGIGELQSAVTALQSVALSREETASVALGNAPAYGVYKSFSFTNSTSRTLTGILILTGGDATTPTSGAVVFHGASALQARRSSAGATTVTGSPAVVAGTITDLAAQWVENSGNARLEVRAAGGPTVRGLLLYRWDESAPP